MSVTVEISSQGSEVTMKVTKQQIVGEVIADGEEDQNLKVVGNGIRNQGFGVVGSFDKLSRTVVGCNKSWKMGGACGSLIRGEAYRRSWAVHELGAFTAAHASCSPVRRCSPPSESHWRQLGHTTNFAVQQWSR
jgi:hypothetical protein